MPTISVYILTKKQSLQENRKWKVELKNSDIKWCAEENQQIEERGLKEIGMN